MIESTIVNIENDSSDDSYDNTDSESTTAVKQYLIINNNNKKQHSKWTYPKKQNRSLQSHEQLKYSTNRKIELNNTSINSENNNNHSKNNSKIIESNWSIKSKIKTFFKKLFSIVVYCINEMISFKLKTWVKLGIFICMLTLVLVAIFKFHVQDHIKGYLTQLQDFVKNEHHGLLFGGLIYMGAFILLIIFFIPVTIPVVFAGIIFGFWYGLLFVWSASMVGGAIAFMVGRFLLRESISKVILKSKRMTAVDQAIGSEGWKIVLLLRLVPIFQESILNYALSVAKISLPQYLICSAFGLLPGTCFFLYCGSMIGSITQFNKKGLNLGKGQIAFYVVGGVLMVVNMVAIGIVVKRAVAKKLKEQEDANEKLLNEKEEQDQYDKDNILKQSQDEEEQIRGIIDINNEGDDDDEDDVYNNNNNNINEKTSLLSKV